MHKDTGTLALVTAGDVATELRRLSRDPWFVLPLFAKILCVILVMPEIHATWFVPFVHDFIQSPSVVPWDTFLAAGGDRLAFPYGPVMLLALVPGVALAMAVAWLFGLDLMAAAKLGLNANILLFDLFLLIALIQVFSAKRRHILYFYWLSPIAIYVNYWHGQLDIVPVVFLVTSLLALRQQRFDIAGLLLGASIAAKFSMLIAVPFMAIYLFQNNRLRPYLHQFAIVCGAVVLFTQMPYMLSESARKMVLATPETGKVFDVALRIDDLQIYVLPIIYLLALYVTWRIRRISFDLLIALLGLGFFFVLLLTPASPGWFLWVVPFLVHHQLAAGQLAPILVGGFSILFVSFQLLRSSGAEIAALGIDASAPLNLLPQLADPHLQSLWLTLLSATGVVLALRMAREGIQRNDYYRLSRRPLVIGIAGDSGTGKDTLAEALEGTFGSHSVVRLSGDDYHAWDRQKPMWQVVTHLNPRANNLDEFSADAARLADGKDIIARHYDHTTGRYSKPRRLKGNDVVVVSGLHALHPPALRQRYDIRIFLDMAEDLRRQLKLHRDVHQRGHSADRVLQSIETRGPDAARFIAPQSIHADIVFRLEPTDPDRLESELEAGRLTRLRLHALLRRSLYHDALHRALVGLCGLSVDIRPSDDGSTNEIRIEGDVEAVDIDFAASQFISHGDELFDLSPRFHDGMLGIMQLIVVAQSAQALRERSA